MEDGQKMFFDFIMERTQDGKKEEMEAALAEFFKPPEDSGSPMGGPPMDGNGSPMGGRPPMDSNGPPMGGGPMGGFRRRLEAITALLKPEAVEEFQKMMNPFGDDSGEPPEIINALVQPNRDKWKDYINNVSTEDMREAIAYSKKAHEMQCDCWNTHCQFFGDCKKCMVFHLCLKQFPTCQRCLLGDLEEHYIVFSRDTEK